MGGNAATPSLAVAVRGLATGSIDPRDFNRALSKGLGVGLLAGSDGCATERCRLYPGGTPVFGLVVGGATCISMTTAATLGGLLPLVFARLRIDPAVASGPFLTTMDISGLTVYLLTAKVLLLT
ncbi:Magnesium transporter MgtE [Candidatus Entotheonellaceae bacterium PAL068K]